MNIDNANSGELNGKYLGEITSDFVKVADMLKEASYQVRARGFSKFPIFPICKNKTEIGHIIIEKETLNLKWNYNISFMEEFQQRQLVATENEETFKSIYKDPDEFCCLFVIDYEFTNFIFVPYPEDGFSN